MNDKIYGVMNCVMKQRNTHQSLHVNSSSSFSKAFLVFCHPIISIVSKGKSKENQTLDENPKKNTNQHGQDLSIRNSRACVRTM